MAELSVDIKANAQQAISQIKTLGVTFEDASNDMEKLVVAGDALDKTTDDIARDLAKIDGRPFKEIKREVDQAEESLKDAARAADDVGDAGKKAGQKAGKGLGDGVKEGAANAKEEIGQSGREAAASFSGGFEDVADFVQESLANALSGFGPAGAAAGIALAAIVGTVLNEAVMTQERLVDARSRANELANTLYNEKGAIPLSDRVSELFEILSSEASPQNGILNLIDQWTDFGTTLDAVKRSAGLTGVGVESLMDSLTGSDLSTAEKTLGKINEKIEDLESNVGTAWAFDENLRGLRDTRDEIQKNIDAQKLAMELNDTAAGKAAAAAKINAEAQAAATEEFQSQVQALGDAWIGATADAGTYFEVAKDGTRSFDWESYLETAEEALQLANDYKYKIVGLPSNIAEEANRVFSNQGALAANQYLDAYIAADDANRGRFEAAAAGNASSAGTAAGTALATTARVAAQNGWTPPDFTVRAKVDTSAYDAFRNHVLNDVLQVNVKAKPMAGTLDWEG